MGDQHLEQQILLLANERFELSLDARQGKISSPNGGTNVLSVTSHRVIHFDKRSGRRVSNTVPLTSLSGVEVVELSRQPKRLSLGAGVLGIGLVLAWVSWVVFATALITLLVGGVPILIGVYILGGYVLPDAVGELVLHASGESIHQPLLTPVAQRDAHLMAHRIFEFMNLAHAPGEPAIGTVTPETPSVMESPSDPLGENNEH